MPYYIVKNIRKHIQDFRELSPHQSEQCINGHLARQTATVHVVCQAEWGNIDGDECLSGSRHLAKDVHALLHIGIKPRLRQKTDINFGAILQKIRDCAKNNSVFTDNQNITLFAFHQLSRLHRDCSMVYLLTATRFV